MNKRKGIKIIILVLLVIISNMLIFKYCNLEDKGLTLSYKLTSDKADTYQLFYANNTNWTEEKSQKLNYKYVNKEEVLKFLIPKDTKELRFDLGNQPSVNIKLSDIKLSYFGKNLNLDMKPMLDKSNQFQIKQIEQKENSYYIETAENDPYITYKIDLNVVNNLIGIKDTINNIIKFGSCIIIDILIFILFKKSKSVFSLAQELKNNRELIWNLAKNDFKTKYAGSYLGITWAFIQPIISILVYWFVFEIGLRSSSPMKGVPFIVWLMSGLVPWFFFQEAMINATNCMLEYSYLVKKVVFKVSILPIIKIISALIIHLVFIMVLFTTGIVYGFYPSIYTIQIFYYSICTFSLVLAIVYSTSAIIIFFKDLGQIISIFLQIGMWMTPIVWSYTIVSKQYQWIVKLNPMYYIVEGYRDTIINHVWFFERYFQTIYFWIITLGLFAIGAMIFKKLKPHFADVL